MADSRGTVLARAKVAEAVRLDPTDYESHVRARQTYYQSRLTDVVRENAFHEHGPLTVEQRREIAKVLIPEDYSTK